MKYKVLLTGKNNVAIDEFFTKMYNSFECQTTSNRYEDMISHLHAFNPDAFVYCLQDEPVDDITKNYIYEKQECRTASADYHRRCCRL
ncbi:MAG: hypothetical protein ACLU70_11020 [Lachnospira sp.]